MNDLISLASAFANWSEFDEGISADDVPCMSESWNNYTDMLCKDGQLCALQYHYCPAYDDPMPGNGSRYDELSDDRAFILDAMNLRMDATRIYSHPDMDEWDASASHWEIHLSRADMTSPPFPYSMGSAHTGEPDLCDVFNCLLRDADSADQSFEDWCSDMDMNEDSRKAYRTWESCKNTSGKMTRLFTESELSDLRDLFSNY